MRRSSKARHRWVWPCVDPCQPPLAECSSSQSTPQDSTSPCRVIDLCHQCVTKTHHCWYHQVRTGLFLGDHTLATCLLLPSAKHPRSFLKSGWPVFLRCRPHLYTNHPCTGTPDWNNPWNADQHNQSSSPKFFRSWRVQQSLTQCPGKKTIQNRCWRVSVFNVSVRWCWIPAISTSCDLSQPSPSLHQPSHEGIFKFVLPFLECGDATGRYHGAKTPDCRV